MCFSCKVKILGYILTMATSNDDDSIRQGYSFSLSFYKLSFYILRLQRTVEKFHIIASSSLTFSYD